MALTDDEIELIDTTIKKIEAIQDKYHAKVAEIYELVHGFRTLREDTPKNVDCTDMTDEQIQTSKTNLLTHAQTIIDTW